MSDPFLDKVRDLPVMPEVAAKVVSLTSGGTEISFKVLEGIIKVDPGLTTKILKIANSALYARQREIKSLQAAITLLGFKTIRSLVLLLAASNLFPRLQGSAFSHAFWRHCVRGAFLARSLAIRCGRTEAADEAFTAGLLHDIGQAVLYSRSPEQYGKALEAERLGAMPLIDLERQLFGTDHRRIGGALLAKWSLPEVYVDAALEHDSTNIASTHKALIIFVSVAGILADRMEGGELPELKRALLVQLLPYTCLAAAEVESVAAEWAGELEKDPLYQGFKRALEG